MSALARAAGATALIHCRFVSRFSESPAEARRFR